MYALDTHIVSVIIERNMRGGTSKIPVRPCSIPLSLWLRRVAALTFPLFHLRLVTLAV